MRGTPVLFRDFSGGVNFDDSPYLIADNEALDARNVVSDDRGAIQKRWGCQKYGPASDRVYESLGAYVTPNQARLFVGVTETGEVWAIEPAAETDIRAGGQSLPSGRVEMMSVPNRTGRPWLHIVGDGVPPTRWNGDTLTDLVPWTLYAPKAPGAPGWDATLDGGVYDPDATYRTDWTGIDPSFITVLDNRVFIADADKATVYFSEVLRPDIFPEENTIPFDTSDGEPITGIGVTGPYVLVFKRTQTYVIYDTDTGANRRLSGNVGCVAPRSIVDSPEGAFFLSHDQGVWRTNGAEIKRVSDGVNAVFAKATPGDLRKAAGGYSNRRYYLSLTHFGVLDYDIAADAWWVHDGNFRQLVRVPDGAAMALYGAGQDADKDIAHVFVNGLTTCFGTEIPWYWHGPWWTFKSPQTRKRVRQIHVDGRGRVDVAVAKDFVIGADVLGTDIFNVGSSTFGGDGDFGGEGIFGDIPTQSEAELYSPGVARAWQVQVSGKSATLDEVDALTLNITRRTD